MAIRSETTALTRLKMVLSAYEQFFADMLKPYERNWIDQIRARMKSNSGLWDRGDPRGHLTASVAALSQDRKDCLFVHHRALDKWLLPGGHCDPFEDPHTSGLREFVEEVGLSDIKLVRFHQENSYSPLDIDVHEIPANAEKNESAHIHIDFRFAVLANDGSMTIADREVKSSAWLSSRQLATHYSRFHDRLEAYL
ncbi:MAG: NUDIX domain-containing protein [Erythrobacter sp.]|nr:NUDIX domain-containing protein [Erythrobacter sp.]